MDTRNRPAPWIRKLGTARVSAADRIRLLASSPNARNEPENADFVAALAAALHSKNTLGPGSHAVEVLRCWPASIHDPLLQSALLEGLRMLCRTRLYRALLARPGGRKVRRKSTLPSITGLIQPARIPAWMPEVASTSAVAIAEAARDVRGYPVNFEAARIAPIIAAVALHARRALGSSDFRPFLDLVDVFPECLSQTARFRWIVGAVELSFGRNFAATARHLRGRLPVKLVSDHDIAVYRAVEGRASVLWALRPGGAAGNGPTAAPLAEAIDWAAHVDRTKPALSSADLARRNAVRKQFERGRRLLLGI